MVDVDRADTVFPRKGAKTTVCERPVPKLVTIPTKRDFSKCVACSKGPRRNWGNDPIASSARGVARLAAARLSRSGLLNSDMVNDAEEILVDALGEDDK